MTKNLQINLLSQQLTNILNQSNLEAGIIVLVLHNLYLQAESALNQQLEKDYKDYLAETATNDNQNVKTTVTKTFSVPLDDIDDNININIGQE